MRYRSIVLAGALVASAAAAQEQKKAADPENSNQPPTADTQQSGDPADPKGYGYGEQPGKEAQGSSAKQSSAPGRAASRTPQDQRPTSGKGEKGTDAAVAGKVVDVSKDRVSVRGEDGSEESLSLTRRTAIFRYGQRIDASRLRPGDEVRASVEQQGDRRVATRITVQSGDSAMQQGTGHGGESVDTPDQAREGIGGRMENTRPEPEKAPPEGPPSGK